MLAFILKRLGLALLVALAVSVIAFVLVRLSGDVATAIAGEGARQEDIERSAGPTVSIGRSSSSISTGSGAPLRGDFGTSLYFKTDVAGLVLDKLPTTLLLGVLSLAVRAPGLDSARRAGRGATRTAGSIASALAFAVVGQALPNFFFALLLIMLFSI